MLDSLAVRTAAGWLPVPVRVQYASYCNAALPFCCNDNKPAVHESYALNFGPVVLKFVKNELAAADLSMMSVTA